MGTFKEEAGSSWTVLNDSDISFITGASNMSDDIKGAPSISDISYFKGTSIDMGIVHQKDEQISETPQKVFMIKENELGFYVETFVISFQTIEKLKIFPLKNEALDYLKNFTEARNLCQGVKEELVFKNVSNLFPGSFSIEKMDNGFVYRSRACNLVAEDSKKQLCGECINIFNTVDDDSRDVNINHYYEIDSEDVDNGIKKDPAECLKVDIKAEVDYSKTDIEDYYFEPEKPSSKHSCNQCDAVFNTSKTLYRHKERCHSVKIEEKEDIENGSNHRGSCKYSCDICSAVFRYKRSFHKHMKQCHSIDIPLPKKGTVRYKSLQCTQCEKAFSATLSYNKHLRDVHGEDVYVPEKRIMKKCPSCEQEFNVSKSSYKLVCHLRLLHHDEDLSSVIEELELGDKGRVVCQICGETKRNKYILASHIKTIHEESDELVPCHICGKLLRQNYGSMYSHLRSHTTEDTPCKYCGHIFKNKISARNHMKSHEPDFKKIDCKECGVKFSRMTHLKNHRRYVHLQIKEAKCDICGKMFSTKSKMNIHRNSVHSQEKPFACEFCQYRSARKDNLQAHRRKTHGVDNKTMMAHTPQVGEIPFYFKDSNYDTSETPQMPAMREDLPTYLKVPSSDKTETPQTAAMRTQLHTFLKYPSSNKMETPHAHHMGELPTSIRDPNSDKSETQQMPAMMRELHTLPTYLKYPSSIKSEILQRPFSMVEDMKNYKNVVAHTSQMGELSSYLTDQSSGKSEIPQMAAVMEDMKNVPRMAAVMEDMNNVPPMAAVMEDMNNVMAYRPQMRELPAYLEGSEL